MPDSDYYIYQYPSYSAQPARPSYPKYTFYLIGICTAVFILQSLFPAITDYFLLSPAFIMERPWGVFTNLFLHADILHILFNMLGLFVFGTALERYVGSKNFLFIFLMCGLIGSAGYLALTDSAAIGALGASGAIFGVIGAVTLLMPNMKVYVMGAIPLQMIIAGPLYVLIEIFYLGTGGGGGIAHSAHVAGFFGGLALAYYFKKNTSVLKLNYAIFALVAVAILTVGVGYEKFPDTSGAKIVSNCLSSSSTDSQLQDCLSSAYDSAPQNVKDQIDSEVAILNKESGD